jgi:hypothetical protein
MTRTHLAVDSTQVVVVFDYFTESYNRRLSGDLLYLWFFLVTNAFSSYLLLPEAK